MENNIPSNNQTVYDRQHIDTYFDLFNGHLSKVKKSNGSNYTALCPFHDDHNPSFSFDADTGLWQCFACGEKGNAWQFADKMHDEEWKRRITKANKREQSRTVENWKKDAIEKASKIEEKAPKKIEKETVYLYHDKNGNVAYEKIRYDFEDGKSFKIEWKTQEKKHLLYDLACLQYIEPRDVSEIWFCEGEKCRDALLEATESRSDVLIFSYSVSPEQEIANSDIKNYLLGKKIIVFIDNDETGEKKASQIIQYAKKYAKQIDVVRFDKAEKGYDVADFLSEGHSIEEALLFSTTEYISKSLIITDVNEYATKHLEPLPILDELYQIPKGILGLVAGMGSVGKGYFLMWNMLRWIEKYSVAYLSAEDSIDILERRLQKLVRKRRHRIANNKEYQVMMQQTKPLVFDALENLNSPSLDALYDVILFYVEQEYDIIIVDPLSAFLDDEKNNSEVAKFMYQLQKLCKTKNINIFLSHHIRKRQKNEQIKDKYDMMELIRGASALHSNSRYVWFLRRNAVKPTAIEVWNVKNSYLNNENDFIIENLLNNDVIKMGYISLSKNGETIILGTKEFYEIEKQIEKQPSKYIESTDVGMIS